MKNLATILALIIAAPSLSTAASTPLRKDTYKPGLAVITLGVNWGRTWKCGPFENAQVEELTFRRTPLSADDPTTIELKTPSKLLVNDQFIRYAFVVEPGKYILSSFDVKVARSVKDVRHLRGTEADLVKDGEPIGGSFTVNAGEVVYIGHFGLDCGAEPFLWRYYLENADEFSDWVTEFRNQYPFAKSLVPQFRLFETSVFGNPFSLPNPTLQ